MHFGVSPKIAPDGNIFYKLPKKKNSCIGQKCQNDVQKFTPTKMSGGVISPPPAICLKKQCHQTPMLQSQGS